MKQIASVTLILLMATSVLNAQKGSLKGVVTEQGNTEAISFASVALSKSGEESAFTGTISDESGSFLLEKIPFGSYTVEVSFLGYQSLKLSDVRISSERFEVDLGRIELEVDAINLEEAEVKAAAKTSLNKIDRRSYRASDFHTASGGSAIDILGKLPSVNVNSENEITVRGSSDFVVYLNGKPTNTEASVLLGQIPSDNIAGIDIITVPSSRFEAQGKGGIINISTKRNTSNGLTVLANGMLGATPWTNGTDVFSNHRLSNNRLNGGVSLNYNWKDLNVHASVNYGSKFSKGIGDIYTYIYQDAGQPQAGNWYILDGMGSRPKWDESFYTSVGFDYRFGRRSDVSVNYNFSKRHSGRAAHYKYDSYFSDSPEDGSPISGTMYEIYNPNDIHRRGRFESANVDYRFFGEENSEITASFLYESSNLDQTIENKEFAYDGDRVYDDYYDENSGDPVFHSYQEDGTPLKAYRFQLDYQKEFGNGHRLELGAGSQNIRLEGYYEYDTVNTSTGDFEGYNYFDNTIELHRDIYAAYADYSGKKEKLSYIIGLRAEYLDQLMRVSSTAYFNEVYEVFGEVGRNFGETNFEQNKFDLFPSMHLRYDADEDNAFTFAASRRINRPPAKDMAPFLYRRHQEIFEMGDPLLEPEYSVNTDLSYVRDLGPHNMVLTGFARSAKNAIYRVNRLDYGLDNSGGVLLRSYTNAGNQLAAGGELGFNFFLLEQVKLFVGGSLYQFSVESNEELFGDQSESSSVNWDAKTNLSWQIAKPLELTVDYSYRSRSVTPQGENLPYQVFNAVLNFSPEKLQGWGIYAKVLDISGTNQAGGYTGATEGSLDMLRRYWVYDYEGQIIEFGAKYTFNKRRDIKKVHTTGEDFF